MSITPEVGSCNGPTIVLRTEIPGPRSVALQDRLRVALPRGLNSSFPIFVTRAKDAWVEDVDGNRFLDFAGALGCANVGHSSPSVIRAIKEQADQLTHACFMVTPYEGYVRLAELLNKTAPGEFQKKTILCNSGAEAVENAVKIARAFTGRPAVIAFQNGFHGRTILGLSLTSKVRPYKRGFGPFVPETYQIPYAYCYRCPYHLRYPDCDIRCADALEEAFKIQVAAESVAAIIFEPVLGEGGFVVPPTGWFHKLAKTCQEKGILLIADEVQTGFARTGSMFACSQVGIVPDLLVAAKSIAGGMPLGAVTGRANIMDAPGPGGLGGTFGGNPIACAAALETMNVLAERKLNERAREFGEAFHLRTSNWLSRYQLIGDIRGLGAMQALELVRDRGSREPAVEETREVISRCRQHGLLIIGAGTHDNVIRLLAPLVVSRSQIQEGLAVLEEAIQAVNSRRQDTPLN